MKKKALVFAAGLAAAFGLQQTANTRVSASEQATVQAGARGQQGPETPQQPMRQSDKRIAVRRNLADHFMPTMQLPYAGGCSPKEWGQYLQRTGRQKWDKKCA